MSACIRCGLSTSGLEMFFHQCNDLSCRHGRWDCPGCFSKMEIQERARDINKKNELFRFVEKALNKSEE